MVLLVIVAVSMLQYFLFHVFSQIKYSNRLITTLVVLLYGFVFPPFFVPLPEEGTYRCGLPFLGVYLGFWVFGGIAAFVVHITYWIKKRRQGY